MIGWRFFAYGVVVPAAGLYILICAGAYLMQDKFIFFPKMLSHNYKFSFEGNFNELFFTPEENVKLHALHFTVPEPKGLVFYLHGNAGSLAGWGEISKEFTELQYDVVIPDYRTYGKSTGKLSEEALLNDAQHIYTKMKAQYPEQKIIIYGRSLGTGIAAWLAKQNNPKRLLLETPYYSFSSLAASYMKWLPVPLLIKYKLPTFSYIEEVKCPVTIIHGTADEVIPYEHSNRLLPHIRTEKELLLVEGGHHNDLRLYEPHRHMLQKALK